MFLNRLVKFFVTIALVNFIFIPYVQAEFSPFEWQYYKSIDYPVITENSAVGISLDNDFLTQILGDFRDVRIIDNDGTEIPYTVSDGSQKDLAKTATILDVSINGGTYDKDAIQLENLFDENRKSYTAFGKDAQEIRFTFKLKNPANIHKVNTFTYDTYNTWDAIQVEASNDQESWKVLRSKISVDHAIWRWIGFPKYTEEYEYYRITFWPKGEFKLYELSLLTENSATLIFTAAPEKQYNLYYGNLKAAQPNYSFDNAEVLQQAALGKQMRNLQWDRDKDLDGVDYSTDNCPFKENPDQSDVDQDGVGDACEGENFIALTENIDRSETISDVRNLDDNQGVVVLDNQDQKAVSDIRDEKEYTESYNTPLSTTEFILYTIAFFIVGILLGIWVAQGKKKQTGKKK